MHDTYKNEPYILPLIICTVKHEFCAWSGLDTFGCIFTLPAKTV